MICAFWDALWLFNKVRANSERLPVSVGKKVNGKCFALKEAGFFSLQTVEGRGGLLHCAVVADISGEKRSQVCGARFAKLPKVKILKSRTV